MQAPAPLTARWNLSLAAETRSRSARLAGEIGSYHLNIDIDAAVTAVLGIFRLVTGKWVKAAPCHPSRFLSAPPLKPLPCPSPQVPPVPRGRRLGA